jgi:hypothetical protein
VFGLCSDFREYVRISAGPRTPDSATVCGMLQFFPARGRQVRFSKFGEFHRARFPDREKIACSDRVRIRMTD